MNTAILVPARSGSQRIGDKNGKPFAGSSLVEIKLKQARRVLGGLDLVLNTDSDIYLKKYEGMYDIGVKRPSFYGSSEVAMNRVYEYFANDLVERGYDNVLYLNATSPLLSDKSLRSIWNRYETDKVPVTTVTSQKEYLWFRNRPMNYTPEEHPRSQDLEPFQTLNFAASALSLSRMRETKNIVLPESYKKEIPALESFDIDEEWQFKVAETLFSMGENQ